MPEIWGQAEVVGRWVWLEFNVAPEMLPDLIHRLLALGPDLLSKAAIDLFPKGNLQAVEFWQKVWDAVRLEERYVPIADEQLAWDDLPDHEPFTHLEPLRV